VGLTVVSKALAKSRALLAVVVELSAVPVWFLAVAAVGQVLALIAELT
jgi:hypothetical protein